VSSLTVVALALTTILTSQRTGQNHVNAVFEDAFPALEEHVLHLVNRARRSFPFTRGRHLTLVVA
jgi:hypothetical protein